MNRMPIAKLILAALMLASVFSCSVKVDPTATLPVDGDGISLIFSCDDEFQVKSEERDGVDALNENLLSSVEYFLYPVGGTANDAVLHGYLTAVRKDAPYSLAITDDVLSARLCPNNAKYFCVYAIANHPRIVAQAAQGQEEDLSGTSVPELEEFTRDLDMSGNSILTPQTNFLMATDGAVTSPQIKRHQTTIATVPVELKRVAAKLTIYVRTDEYTTIENTVVINGVSYTRNEIWRPRTDEMQIYLVNGAKTGKVSGAPVANSDLVEYQPFEFDLNSGVTRNYSTWSKVHDGYDEDNNELYHYEEVQLSGTFNPCKSPFYTYPESWEYGSESEPYLKLMIPWDRDPGSNDDLTWGSMSKQYYYRVYCPGSALDGTHAQFLRNNWYEIFLNVSILGSELEGGALEIQGNYYVVDWQERDTGSGSGGQGSGINDSDKEAEIKGARYLFVNDTDYTLYNVDDLMIPYVTSDPCEIVDISAYKYDFSGTTKNKVTTTDISSSSWNMTLELQTTATGAHIHFYHQLNNDLTGGSYDVSEYTIVFTLQHKDATSYSKQITIRQRPAIMIDLDQNSDTGKTHYGYAYVNGASGAHNPYYYTYGSSLYGKYANASGTVRDYYSNGYKQLNFYLGSAPGVGSSSNENYNMVVIETSVLPSDSPYMLGDPRKTTIDNLNNTDWPSNASTSAASAWSMSSASVQGTNRYMSYYYPTNPDASANNIIAPKFRIASSWGATQPMHYADAFRRCASYQEDGYPAGRWRVPTVAEIQYIAQLNADGMITRLLGAKTTSGTNGSSTNYWCNSGYMVVYNGENSDWPQNGNRIPAPVIGTDNPDATTDGSSYYVRCVYDDWYWDNFKLNGTDISTVGNTSYKWGDVAR